MSRIFFLCLGVFALGVDAYIMAGLLPSIGSTFAVSPSSAGQTVSIFTVFYALSAPVFGALTAGKPVRRVLIIALGIFAIANACSALSGSFPMLLVTRAIAGMGAGLFTPLAVSAAAALVPADRRGRALGLVIGGLAMGTAVGVPVGLVLAAHVGWRATLWMVTTLGAAALIGIALRLPDVPVTPPPSLKQRIAILADGRVTATVTVSFLTAVASIGLYTYVAPMFLTAAGTHNVVPFLWAWSLGGLAGTYFVGICIDKTGRPEWVMAVMLTAMAVSFIALSSVLKEHSLSLLCFFVWGVAAWGSQAPQQHRLLSLQPEHGSTAVALHSSAHYLGSAVGAALGGFALAAGTPVSKLPLFALVIVLVTLAIQLLIASRRAMPFAKAA
ncbi:MFS transporter [Caballeronia sp. M23-90]